jgi:nickel-dependent lactate racemase
MSKGKWQKSKVKTQLPWGETQIELRLPSDWRVIAEGQPKSVPACGSVEDEFMRAMSSPIGAVPLARRDLRGKKIVLVVDDITRPTPAHLFVPYLVRELERAGADRRGLLILAALGVHRPMTETEMERKVGRESLRGLRWENHNAYDAGGLALLGTTCASTRVLVNRRLSEADLIVAVGSIEPHVLAGFGGGLKLLVPGCAGAETVAHNHLCGATGEEMAAVGADPEANPLRRDLEEAATLLGKEVFLVNTVLNAGQEIVRIFAGHAQLAHREGIGLARAIYGVPVPEPADILITNSAPMDTDLRQGTKCIGNLLGAVKEGGTILAFLRCREGAGDFKVSGRSLPRPLLKVLVRRMNRHQMLSFLDRFRRDLEVEEKFLALYSLRILKRNEVLAYAPALTIEQGRRLGALRVVPNPEEMVRRAAARAPKRATVAIFPRGGVTFPVLPLVH